MNFCLYGYIVCKPDYSSGITWKKQRSNEISRVNCSDLHPNFQSKVYITRPCYYNREWGSVDLSECTMKPNSSLLVMIEVAGFSIATNAALIIDDVSRVSLNSLA